MRRRLTTSAGVVKLDPWLAPFQDALKRRFTKAKEWIKTINDTEGGIDKFSRVRPSSPKSEAAISDANEPSQGADNFGLNVGK